MLVHEYISVLTTKSKGTFGIRNAISSDAPYICEVFKSIYEWEYLYPKVYNKMKLIEEINEEQNYWFCVDKLNEERVVGVGLLRKESEISIYAGKTVLKKAYQGLGISQLGTECIFSFLSHPRQENILRFDTDVRATNKNSQKFADKVRCIPYGFIPNYNNYADKRNFDPSERMPFSKGKIEPVIMYVSPIRTYWKKRSRNIYFAKNQAILSFYNELKKHTNRLGRDHIHMKQDPSRQLEKFNLKKDYYKSCIKIDGYLKEETIQNLLQNYSNWNVIEWRVPTTQEGLSSQYIALRNNFLVVGYDPGSFIDINTSLENTFVNDTILFCLFPNGIDYDQFNNIKIFKKNQGIVDLVLEKVKNGKMKV
ncbi:MAG: hypothetical protein BAJALOKI1v1_1170009 [Promethearchaeota archaeon]|nr:MAG: hypothetical protein BAJALOKI1v1_1170009 [Candidatus Lokiarchaeota archaeon]